MSRRHDTEAARSFGLISSVHAHDKGFVFATTADMQEVFLHRSAFRPMDLFDEVIVGDGVSFAVAEAPKGLRGHDIRRMTETERLTFTQQQTEYSSRAQDRRGNRAEHGQRQSFVDAINGDDGQDRVDRRSRQHRRR